MAKNRHSGAFIFGSIVGGAVGALAALWNTPQSGQELRRKLGFESEAAQGVTAAARSATNAATSAVRSTGGMAGSALHSASDAAASAAQAATGAVSSARQPASDTAMPAGTTGSSLPGSGLPGKALGLVERAAAPLVGVKLGQTANNSQPVPGGEPVDAVTIAEDTIEGVADTTTTAPVATTPAANVPVMPQGAK